MKKITSYLIALAVMAFTFTSCEDVPAPFGDPINPNESTETGEAAGTGTQSDPFNIAAAVAKCVENSFLKEWLQIVRYLSARSFGRKSNCRDIKIRCSPMIRFMWLHN